MVDRPNPELSRNDESRRTAHVRAVTSTCTELQPVSKVRGGWVGWGAGGWRGRQPRPLLPASWQSGLSDRSAPGHTHAALISIEITSRMEIASAADYC